MFKIIRNSEAAAEYSKCNYDKIIKETEQKILKASKEGGFCIWIDSQMHKLVKGYFYSLGFKVNDDIIDWENPTVDHEEKNNALYYKNLAEKINEDILKKIDKRIRDHIHITTERTIDLSDLNITFGISNELTKAGYKYNVLTKTLTITL